MKDRITTIEFPVFSYYVVHVEITSDVKKAMQKYAHTKCVPESEITDAMSVHVSNANISYIFLKYNSSVGTVAHESWHVVHRMMRYMGVDIDSETVAYHLGYLTNEVFRFLRGKK